MLLVTYQDQGIWRAGIEQDGMVLEAAVVHDFAPGAPSSLRELLNAGSEELQATLGRAAERLAAGGPGLHPLSDVRLGPPVPDPDKIICLGYNYAEHATESEIAVPVAPNLFAKFRSCLVGQGDEIVLPSVSTQIDYEGELAVVIGSRCRRVEPRQALGHVAGYTIMNDVTARDLQFRTTQYTAGKALDTFAPMGPGILPAASIPSPQKVQIRTRVNGQVLQDGSTSEMIFPVAETISFISQLMTLEPGDIIATGTPVGVGYKRNPPIFLKAGDTVEVSIDGIGSLRNPVVAVH